MSYEPGQKVGDYEILEILGAGGMGEVYKVRNVISDRVEAMKILLPDLAGQQELAGRFLREIKVLAGLDHPNIASLRTALHVGNQLVMIMELVEGTTLAHRLRGGSFPEREAVEFISQVLSALSYAHSRGIVHRDIKPANMMLTRSGIVKLMDFGIARAAGETKLTMTGSTLGSIYYMSPEQVQGQSLDARSDLYSLGVSLYELVTAQHPFEGDTSFTIMKGHIEGSPVPPREVNPNLSPALNEVILRGMAKDPDERYQTAEEFSSALQKVKQIIQTSAASAGAVAPSAAATTPSRPAFPPTAVRPATASAPPPPAQPPAPYTPTVVTRSQPQATTQATFSSAPTAPVVTHSPQPVAPVTEAPASGAAVPPQVPRTKRAIYIALGSALTLIIIVLTAMKLPVFQSSSSDSKSGASAPSKNAGAPTSDTSPQPNSATPSTPAGGSAQPDTTAGTAAGNPPGASAASAENSAAAAKKARAAAAAKQEQDAQAAAAAAAAQAAAEEAAKLFDEQENRFIHMSARAAAMKTSYETLRNQQAAAGYSPDSSLTTAVRTMEQFLGRADAALSAHDGATAKKYMDIAEPQIAILERRFGR